MDDENSVYSPEYLSESSGTDDGSIYVPSYLSDTDEYGISLAAVIGSGGSDSDSGDCSESGYCGTVMEPECGTGQDSCTDYDTMYCGTSMAPCTETPCNETDVPCTETGTGDCGESTDNGTTASLTIGKVTSNSVTVYVTTDSDYAYYRIFCRLYGDESDTSYDRDFSLAALTSSGGVCVITGLEPDTHYILNLGVFNGVQFLPSDLWVYSGDNPTFTTLPEGDFAWTYAGLNSSGVPVLGDRKTAGLGIYVTAAEWNELIAVINDKCGTSLGTVTPGAEISEAIVNPAANALGVGTVEGGVTAISAEFFNDLMDAVNAL